MQDRFRILLLTLATLVAFAANSVLCRMALGEGHISPAGFTQIRLLSGAAVLFPFFWLRRGAVWPPRPADWRPALALFVYAFGFSLAYVALDAGTGALILFATVQVSMIGLGIAGGDRPGRLEWAGLAVALAGLVWLLAPISHSGHGLRLASDGQSAGRSLPSVAEVTVKGFDDAGARPGPALRAPPSCGQCASSRLSDVPASRCAPLLPCPHEDRRAGHARSEEWGLTPGLHAPPLWAAALMGVAGAAWGVYSLLGRREGDSVAATARNFLFAVPLALALFVSGSSWGRADTAGIALAVTSGAVTSGLGYVIWYAALPGLTPMSASVVQLAVPAVAAAGGILFLGESLTVRLTVATVLILGGIYVTVRASRNRAKP